MTETFYDLLGVAEDASTAAIEEAYRDEIKQVHPDVSDDVDAGERTKRLNKARRVLTDERERARYDRQGHEAYTSSGPTTSNAGNEAESATDSPDGETGVGGERDDTGGSRSDRYRRQRRGRAGNATAGRANRPGPGSSTGNARGSGSVSNSDGPRTGRDGRRSSGQGRKTGPTESRWQSSGAQATAGPASSADGPSARRQAAAGTTSGPNADWSWNAWEQTRSWAVRRGGSDSPSLDPERFVPTQQSALLFVSMFFLYPFFVASALSPAFPMVVRLLVATCTLVMFAYLLSVPEVAVTVFGLWSVLAPLALVALPGVGLVSVVGVVTLSVTWVPCALSVLTLSMLEA